MDEQKTRRALGLGFTAFYPKCLGVILEPGAVHTNFHFFCTVVSCMSCMFVCMACLLAALPERGRSSKEVDATKWFYFWRAAREAGTCFSLFLRSSCSLPSSIPFPLSTSLFLFFWCTLFCSLLRPFCFLLGTRGSY